MLKKKEKVTEIVLYSIYGLIALGGLVLIVLDLIGMNMPNLTNPLRTANENFMGTMKMSFLVFGTLLFIFAAILAAITLTVNGHKVELIEEKRARRRQRMELENDAPELE